MLARNLIKIFTSCYIVGVSAREEGDFPVDFHLKILAYPDDKDIRAKKLMDKECKAMVQVGSVEKQLWCDGVIGSFAAYPDKPDDLYLQLNELIFSRGSPDPQIVKVLDATDGGTQTICSVTLTSDPKVPRLDWFVGWGLDFKNTMNEFIGGENFKIECEAESEDMLIGRELKWK